MPENGYLGSSHPSYALRARSAGAPRLRIRIDSSRAQNPDPQRLRRRFFMPKNRGTSNHKCAFCYFSHPGLACFAKA